MGLIKLNNRGVRSATTFGSVSGGSFTFIKKVTASSSATVSFVDGTSDVVLDDTYKEYMFTFNNMHPATDNTFFNVNFSIDSGSNYNVAKTTTFFFAYHKEDDTAAALAYEGDQDLAQGTGFQRLGVSVANDNDSGVSGYLHLFNPSSTTFVKHFISTVNNFSGGDFCDNNYIAGYANTTSAVDAVQFKMESGNTDAGDICLYGIK